MVIAMNMYSQLRLKRGMFIFGLLFVVSLIFLVNSLLINVGDRCQFGICPQVFQVVELSDVGEKDVY